jgi:hypothetical protein
MNEIVSTGCSEMREFVKMLREMREKERAGECV